MTTGKLPNVVSVSELAGDLTGSLALVGTGATLIVTRHGVPIATIAPVDAEVATAEAGGSIARESSAVYVTGRAAAGAAGATALTRLISAPAMRAVLAVFLKDSASVLHQREVARQAGLGLRSAQIALKKLVDLGLLAAERDGNRLNYRAVRTERFEALRMLLARELGIGEVIARHLAALPTPVAWAFIFGSIARGDDTMASDIDLLVVCDASADELVEPIAEAQRELGREIDLVHYRVAEFKRRRTDGNHFVEAILAQPRIDVMGAADDS